MDRAQARNRSRPEIPLRVALCLVFLLIFASVFWNSTKDARDSLYTLSDGWYYILDGQEIPVTLPDSIAWTSGDTFSLYNRSIPAQYGGMTLTTQAAEYEVQILWNGNPLYVYDESGFPRNAQMKHKLNCDAALPSDLTGGILCLVYSGAEDGIYHIPVVQLGSSTAVMQEHVSEAILTLMISLIMAFLALIVLLIAAYLRKIRLWDPRILNVALFLLLCAVWCTTDAALVQDMSSCGAAVRVISFYAFMLLALPMLRFVQHTLGEDSPRVLQVCVILFYCNAIAQGILAFFGGLEFIQMLLITHLLLGFSIIVSVLLLVRKYRASPSKHLRYLLCAFAAACGGGFLSLIFYWILDLPNYELIFELGLMVYILLLLASVIMSAVENFQLRTELEVAQRLALEDDLTGFGTSRALDAYLDGLELSESPPENAVLVYLDVAELRNINNSLGHSAGDELVIAAARCIEAAFGDIGRCFRISGDEFCVVAINPRGTQADWNAKLNRAILQFNLGSGRVKLALFRGFGYLRREDGSLRSISEWKYKADRDLFANKGRGGRL